MGTQNTAVRTHRVGARARFRAISSNHSNAVCACIMKPNQNMLALSVAAVPAAASIKQNKPKRAKKKYKSSCDDRPETGLSSSHIAIDLFKELACCATVCFAIGANVFFSVRFWFLGGEHMNNILSFSPHYLYIRKLKFTFTLLDII